MGVDVLRFVAAQPATPPMRGDMQERRPGGLRHEEPVRVADCEDCRAAAAGGKACSAAKVPRRGPLASRRSEPQATWVGAGDAACITIDL